MDGPFGAAPAGLERFGHSRAYRKAAGPLCGWSARFRGLGRPSACRSGPAEARFGAGSSDGAEAHGPNNAGVVPKGERRHLWSGLSCIGFFRKWGILRLKDLTDKVNAGVIAIRIVGQPGFGRCAKLMPHYPNLLCWVTSFCPGVGGLFFSRHRGQN